MSNSSMVVYTKISPNRTSPRNHKIDKITIHHMAGNATIESCGNEFQKKERQASSNYGIGTDGRVAMYVEEKDRSWASSNSANDNRAVTIEVANCGGDPDWPVSDKAMASLIDLCVDICKRNGIPKLNFTGNKDGNLTMHCYFAATACPGPYLKSKFQYIANEVNKRLTGAEQPESEENLYRIRKSWDDAKSQKGAYKNLNAAKSVCPDGYTVYDKNGNAVYTKAAASTAKPATQSVSKVNIQLKVLKKGMPVCAEVKTVQRLLYCMGYNLGYDPIDGNFGSLTHEAVCAFQEKKNLPSTGIVDEQTWKKLLGTK